MELAGSAVQRTLGGMSDKAAPSISEVMTTEVITADRSQALSEVYDLFESRNIHHLPVMDGQKPVGMVSASDVLRLVYDIEDPTDRMMRSMLDHQFNIDDAMTEDLDTLTVDATVRDAADRLSGGDYHSVVVIDAVGHLAGIVTSTDLIRYLRDHV